MRQESGAFALQPHPGSRRATEQPRDEDLEGSERSAMEANVDRSTKRKHLGAVAKRYWKGV